MKKILLACLIVACMILGGCGKKMPEPLKITIEENGRFTCEYGGIQRSGLLYLPENEKGAPLVVMLHGYGSDGKAFQSEVQLEKVLVPAGYAVVYVDGIADPEEKTSASGWNSGLGASGKDDVGFLSSMTLGLQETYGFDTERTYAAGFSNGAFMTYRLGVEEAEIFHGIISVAGMMPEKVWKNRPKSVSLSVLQISGTADDVVPRRSDCSAEKSGHPAIEDVCGYFAQAAGLEAQTVKQPSDRVTIVKYNSDQRKEQVWEVTLEGGRHSWPTEQFNGLDTNELILEFLESVK